MKKEIRIVQLIDSLDAGGAERMAVNYANTLADVISFSGLVTTRKEGALKDQLSEKVTYLFLNKKGKLGWKAVLKFRAFIKQNKIDVIHAHSTSFFTAALVKLSYPKVKFVWHDHYGNSEFLAQRNTLVLKAVSSLFQGIISVNLQLRDWATQSLAFKNVIYLPNFFFFTEENESLKQTNLEGISGKRIICLANLREQKNHFMLLKVAELLKKSHADWSLHLVGKDFEDDYSKMLRTAVVDWDLTNHVFIYGSRNDVGAILNASDIAILSSKSEGLPVALLEYGFYKKPVLATRVGEIPKVIEHNVTGVLVDSGDAVVFYQELARLIDDSASRYLLAQNLHTHIMGNYSGKAILGKYLGWLCKSKFN
jgi:glycosyltransferase involved in cell wall biosynthesis